MITHKEKEHKNMDVGHTIVNVYCSGNTHPDYPIPQSLVRQALDSNNLPLYQQQELGNFLRQEIHHYYHGTEPIYQQPQPIYQQPIYQQPPQIIPQAPPQIIPQAPPQIIPQAPPQIIPQAPQPIIQPVKKHPAVQTNIPIIRKPPTESKENIDENDDETAKEEKEAQRLIKLKEERLKEASLGTRASEAFKKRLESKLTRK